MVGRIAVSLPALETAVGDLSAGMAGIEATLADLRGYLAPMVETWSGSAAESYRCLQRDWDAAAADLQASLTQLHGVVLRAHTRYRVAEGTNVRIWSADGAA